MTWKSALDSVVGRATGRSAPSEELAEAKARVRRLRRRLKAQKRALESTRERLEHTSGRLSRAQDELTLLRRSSLDLYPDIEIPAPVQQVCDGVLAEHLTYLQPEALRSVVAAVLETERADRPGLIVEAGTALGGSAIAMAAAKAPGRRMRVYDAFGMIPPPGEKDTDRERARYEQIVAGASRGLGQETYYGYREDLLGEVTASFARFGLPVAESDVQLVPGLFEDTIDLDEPVALVHLDGDWYDSTMTCLTRLVPLLVPGGRVIVDDYFHWTGCRTAVDEFVEGRTDLRVEHRAKVHLVKR